jgi:acyl phosphate:glycerol-3-phosphate acyltransferase
MMTTQTLILTCAIFYLIGAIPTGFILVKIFMRTDIRTVGSRNTGATNVLRASNKSLAALTLIADAFKIFIPLWVSSYVLNPMQDTPVDALLAYYILLGSMGAIGHMYSPLLKFDGGKGISSMLGLILWVCPMGAMTGLFIFAISIFATKIVSLSTLLGLIAGSIYAAFEVMPSLMDVNVPDSLRYSSVIFYCATVILIFWRHRTNIQRLLQGQEKKITKYI